LTVIGIKVQIYFRYLIAFFFLVVLPEKKKKVFSWPVQHNDAKGTTDPKNEKTNSDSFFEGTKEYVRKNTNNVKCKM